MITFIIIGLSKNVNSFEYKSRKDEYIQKLCISFAKKKYRNQGENGMK